MADEEVLASECRDGCCAYGVCSGAPPCGGCCRCLGPCIVAWENSLPNAADGLDQADSRECVS